MTKDRRQAIALLLWIWLIGIVLAGWIVVGTTLLRSEPYLQPDLTDYFNELKQPDQPGTSCCGESDVYYADEVEACLPTDGPNCWVVAIVTDTRPDQRTIEPAGITINRPHVPVGTRVVVPTHKRRLPPYPNPTDHTLLFLSPGGAVYCYEPQGGV